MPFVTSLLLLPLLLPAPEPGRARARLVWRQELASTVQAVSPVWDVDGDGLADLALGQPEWRSLGGRGRVVLLSAETGEVLEVATTRERRLSFGESLALDRQPGMPPRLGVSFESGSIDKAALGVALLGPSDDGLVALEEHGVLAAPGQRAIVVRPEHKQVVVAAGDLDGDGVGDWVLGAPAHPVPGATWASGRVLAFRGVGGRPLWDRTAREGESGFGTSLARVSDVNGDGSPEVLVGSPGTGSERSALGSLHLMSGADGEDLQRTLGRRVGQALGRLLQPCGQGALVGARASRGDGHEVWFWDPTAAIRRVLELPSCEPGDEPRLWVQDELLLLGAVEGARASLWLRPLDEVAAGAGLGPATLPNVAPVVGESESMGPLVVVPRGAGLRVVGTRRDGEGHTIIAAWDLERPAREPAPGEAR